MECAACGRANDADARFCAGCGSKLANTCPSCGHENAADANFCNRCGTGLGSAPLPSAEPAPDQREARRLATALFIDLVGFTPFTEQHDPEEVRAMLMRYFDVAREVVTRFGGEID
ncbi:MAG: zinc-ribbon domain-containing protein [Acidimicrobiia bacterium]|nr:MAG: zinc-ribbon domain-containing protein [Acidimicrobiia bacterium]